jgi:hypothetical protein
MLAMLSRVTSDTSTTVSPLSTPSRKSSKKRSFTVPSFGDQAPTIHRRT